MRFETLSCGAVIDANGVVHPSLEMARRYAAWQPGAGLLGLDWQAALDRLVHARLTDIHDECTDSREAVADFLKAESALRRDLWRRIRVYEKSCKEYRRVNGLRPFDWSLESEDSVTAAFRDYRGSPRLPRTAAETASYREASAAKEFVNPYLVPSAVLDQPRAVNWREYFSLSDVQAAEVIALTRSSSGSWLPLVYPVNLKFVFPALFRSGRPVAVRGRPARCVYLSWELVMSEKCEVRAEVQGLTHLSSVSDSDKKLICRRADRYKAFIETVMSSIGASALENGLVLNDFDVNFNVDVNQQLGELVVFHLAFEKEQE